MKSLLRTCYSIAGWVFLGAVAAGSAPGDAPERPEPPWDPQVDLTDVTALSTEAWLTKSGWTVERCEEQRTPDLKHFECLADREKVIGERVIVRVSHHLEPEDRPPTTAPGRHRGLGVGGTHGRAGLIVSAVDTVASEGLAYRLAEAQPSLSEPGLKRALIREGFDRLRCETDSEPRFITCEGDGPSGVSVRVDFYEDDDAVGGAPAVTPTGGWHTEGSRTGMDVAIHHDTLAQDIFDGLTRKADGAP